MKTILIVTSILAALVNLQAQSTDTNSDRKDVNHFNGFQHTKSDPAKINQALFHAQALARRFPGTLQMLLHDHYAQGFSKNIRGNRDNTNERKLLNLFMNDTSQVLIQTATPIYLWVQVQENENNPSELIKIANTFIDTQFDTLDLHDNRTARYALLIYQVLQNKRECTQVAQVLFDKTTTSLGNTIHKYDLPGDDLHNWRRAWYRYLYATIHFLQAEKANKQGDLVNAEKLYRIAANYSPDTWDKKVLPAYDYDRVFLHGKNGGDTYKEAYVNFLASNPDKSLSLQALTALAIEKPANITKLQAFYTEHFAAKEPFAAYWERELNKELKPAPEFVIRQLNDQLFSLKENTGKWILLDFWGTWCAPCLEEMPKMQSFHREVAAKHVDKLFIITIACKDTEMKVRTFMNKYRYNFPVAIADDFIESAFSIRAYPTKILITPQGNSLPITFGEDWVTQVKMYTQIQ